jgi:hypothetical protein
VKCYKSEQVFVLQSLTQNMPSKPKVLQNQQILLTILAITRAYDL